MPRSRGKPLVRYVATAELAELDDAIVMRQQSLKQAQLQEKATRSSYEQKRNALNHELAALQS